MPDRLQPGDAAIDRHQVKALFDGLDAVTAQMLLDAAQRDLAEWTDRLVAAWHGGDQEAQSRARHALKGLCGHFGATGLLALCEADLSKAAVVNRLQASRVVSMAAVAQVVENLHQ